MKSERKKKASNETKESKSRRFEEIETENQSHTHASENGEAFKSN